MVALDRECQAAFLRRSCNGGKHVPESAVTQGLQKQEGLVAMGERRHGHTKYVPSSLACFLDQVSSWKSFHARVKLTETVRLSYYVGRGRLKSSLLFTP